MFAKHRRKGVAILLVLALLAVTLTISYAVLRSETTSTMVESNRGRMDDARLAAMSGISAGLRKIHTNAWGGIGSQLTGDLGNGSSYTVDYVAGDDRLTSSHPEYALLPYRVTLRSTGTATRADGSGSISHTIEVVVQLVPRTMQTTPANWAKVQSYSLYQWQNQPITFEIPAQIAGKVHAQGALSFMLNYPSSGTRYPFHGYIDEVAVFNSVLPATQILAIYTAATAGDPTSLYTSSNPVAYWKMNEATGTYTAADSAGTNTGLFISSKPGQSTRPFTTAASSAFFDGKNDHVQCSDLNVSGNLSVLAWFRASSLTSDMRIVSKGSGESDAEQCWKLSIEQVSSDYRLTFGVTASGIYKESQMNTGTLLPNVWYLAAATYDGDRMHLYLNGVHQRNIGHVGTLATNSSAPIIIGDTPPGSAKCRMLHDLYQAKLNGVGDYRPMTQSWETPSGKITALDTNLLQDDLKVTVSTVAVDNTAPAAFPVSGTTYQLFPGGATYSIPSIAGPLQNTQLLADPISNPLGIFRCSNDLEIENNVTVQGTIMFPGSTSYDLEVSNNNITWTPVDLLTLSGESVARQLPIAMVPACFMIEDGCTNVQMRGQIVAGDQLHLEDTDTTTSVRLQGSCVTGKVYLKTDARWPTSAATWKSYLLSYIAQRSTMGGQQYFPMWLCTAQSINPNPRVVITPDNQNRIYHWPDFSQAIFQPHPSDPGLRWKVVAWTDKS